MLEALEAWPLAAFLRRAHVAYLAVNAAHILGIGLLVGAILPLDLRLIGLFPRVPLAVLGPFLSRAAVVGAALAVATGLCLFSVQPRHYVANAAFLWKLALLAVALANALLLHASQAYRRALGDGAVAVRVRLHAALSFGLWLAVLLAGRWIGFL